MAASHASAAPTPVQGQDDQQGHTGRPAKSQPRAATTRRARASARDANPVEAALSRYRPLILAELKRAVSGALATTHAAAPLPDPARRMLATYYAQMEYHLGWRDADLEPIAAHAGKLMRPALVLLACELAAGQHGAGPARRARMVRRAVPAAVAVELIHNFSLIHDDIEDGDEERRHRPTLWKLSGVARAINIGDGMFSLARARLWTLPQAGVAPAVVVRLAALLDRTCIELCEGQDLDMRFEGKQDISVAMYLAMIGRKTAAIMACAMEMGAILGAPNDATLARQLGEFGQRLGLAFQVRDDLLGIWSAEALGKSYAGDLRRKKMSLPAIIALEQATPVDHDRLAAIYAEPGPASDEQIAEMLAILDRTHARERTRAALGEQCGAARAALEAAASTAAVHETHDALAALLAFVAAEGI